MQVVDNLSPELARAWHPVALSSEVTDRPLAVKLLGEPWVLARTDAGLVALRDRCPHRNAPLSAGRVVDGAIECPYHGWRFVAGGACVHIPALGAHAPARSAAAQAPAGVQERYGLVWLAPEPPLAPLMAFPEWDDPAFRSGAIVPLRTRASAAQLVDNFLDVTHFHFLHRDSFGLAEPDPIGFYEVERGATSVTLEHRTLFSNGSGPLVPRTGHYHCTLPFQCRLVATFPGSERIDVIVLLLQPEDAHATRLYKLLAFNSIREDELPGMIDFETRVIKEDLVMTERLASPALPLEIAAQAHARGDGVGIAWRRALQALFSAREESGG